MPGSRAALTALISGNTPLIAAAVNEPVVRFLVVSRDLCGGDLDMLLVLMVIIQRANLHPDFRAIDAEAIRAGDDGPMPALDVNVQSIADSTRIPKETVRRKVARLLELGWIERDGRKLRYTAEGYRAMDPAREVLIRMTARIAEAVTELEATEASPKALRA